MGALGMQHVEKLRLANSTHEYSILFDELADRRQHASNR